MFEAHDAINVTRAEEQPIQRGREGMAIFKNANFDERRNAAEAAKQAKLEKFRALTAQINENAAERQTARQAIIAARDVRAAEREAAARPARRLRLRSPTT